MSDKPSSARLSEVLWGTYLNLLCEVRASLDCHAFANIADTQHGVQSFCADCAAAKRQTSVCSVNSNKSLKSYFGGKRVIEIAAGTAFSNGINCGIIEQKYETKGLLYD